MSAERVLAVVSHPRFYRSAWIHVGACRQFEIGLHDEPCRVRWLRSETAKAAFEQAARVLLDGEDIKSMPGYAG